MKSPNTATGDKNYGIDLAIKLSQRLTMSSISAGYVNSWCAAPKELYEQIWENYVPELSHMKGGKRMPSIKLHGQMMILYAHLIDAWCQKRHRREGVPVSSKWLRSNFRICLRTLLQPKTGIILVKAPVVLFGSADGSGSCTRIGFSRTLSGLVSGSKGATIAIRDFLQSKGVSTKSLKFHRPSGLTVSGISRKDTWRKTVLERLRLQRSHTPDLNRTLDSAANLPTQDMSVEAYNTPPFLHTPSNPTSSIGSHKLSPSTVPCHFSLEGLIPFDLETCDASHAGEGLPVDLKAAWEAVEALPGSTRTEAKRTLQYIQAYTVEGEYTPVYEPTSFCGRYYERGGGTQSLKREVKQALFQAALDSGFLYNYDIKKCQATALELLATHLGLDPGPICRVLDEFDDLCVRMGLVGHESLLKLAIYCTLWGGSHSFMVKLNGVVRMTACGEEFSQKLGCEGGRKSLALVAKVLKPVAALVKKIEEVLGCRVGAVVTNIEQLYIHTLVVLCHGNGIRVLSLQHDGVVTDKMVPDWIAQFAAYVSGFRSAELVQKDFSERVSMPIERELSLERG